VLVPAAVACVPALIAIAVFLSPTLSTVLQFDRAALASGQVWRILTCHWTHWSADHLLWDAVAFAVLAWACVSRRVPPETRTPNDPPSPRYAGKSLAERGDACPRDAKKSFTANRRRGVPPRSRRRREDDRSQVEASAGTEREASGLRPDRGDTPRLGHVAWTVLLSALLIPAAVWLACPELETYRGLSGVDSALLTLLAVGLLRDGLRPGGRRAVAAASAAVLLGFGAKLLYELASGAALFVDAGAAGFVPVPVAHAAGAAVGALGACARRGRDRRIIDDRRRDRG
jgi:hypothetical protein